MKNYIEKIKKFAWLWLPLVTACIITGFFPLMYLTEDDTMLNNVLGDVSVSGSDYFNYCGVLLGKILRAVYLLLPALNWYAILSVVMLTGSFCMLLRLIECAEEESGQKQPLLLALGRALIFFLFVYNLFHLSFTNVAFYATLAAGLLFLFQKPPYIRKNIFISLFSVLWFVVGASFRGNAAKTVAVYLIVFILIRLFKTRAKLPVLFVVVIVAFLGWHTYSKTDYAAKDDTAHPLYDYWHFDQVRRVLVDYNSISYEEHKEALSSIGIEKEDLSMYYSWSFADINVFDPDTFGKTIFDIKANEPKKGMDVFGAAQNMLSSVLPMAYLALLLIAFLLAKKNNRLFMFLACGEAAGAVYLLFLRERVLWRMQLTIFSLGLVVVLFVLLMGDNRLPAVLPPFKKKPKLQSACVFLAVLLAVGVVAHRSNQLIASQEAVQEGYAPIKNYLKTEAAAGKHFVSLVEHRIHFYYPEITLFQNREAPYFVNIGEADVFHPHWYAVLDACGFEDFHDSVFRALIDGEEVYAFSNDKVDFYIVEGFLERHYAEEVSFEVVENVDGWYIASFKEEKTIKE